MLFLSITIYFLHLPVFFQVWMAYYVHYIFLIKSFSKCTQDEINLCNFLLIYQVCEYRAAYETTSSPMNVLTLFSSQNDRYK